MTTTTPTKHLTFHKTTTGRYFAENRAKTRRYVVTKDHAGQWLVMKFTLRRDPLVDVYLAEPGADWVETEDTLKYGKALAEEMDARYDGRESDRWAWNDYRSH